LNNDDHVAGIFLSDPTIIYNLDDKKQAVIRIGVFSKHNPAAYDAQQSQDHCLKSYEAILTNTQNITQMMAAPNEVTTAEEVRVEI
jgi:hypothetical protein